VLRTMALLWSIAALAGCGGGESKAPPGGPPPEVPPSIPAPPSNLTATAGNGIVSLAWSGSTGTVSYNVKRAIETGGPFVQLANPAFTQYVDTTVANGTAYFYIVTATSSAGESAASAQASATPAAPAQPGPPDPGPQAPV